jgi:hypothetical protein
LAPSEPICPLPDVTLGPLTRPNPNEIAMDITNASGSPITISRFFAYWVESPSSQRISGLLLNGVPVLNPSDPDSPTDIPTESSWLSGANLTIQDATTSTLLIEFGDNLQTTGYEVHIVFGAPINCQVVGNQ